VFCTCHSETKPETGNADQQSDTGLYSSDDAIAFGWLDIDHWWVRSAVQQCEAPYRKCLVKHWQQLVMHILKEGAIIMLLSGEFKKTLCETIVKLLPIDILGLPCSSATESLLKITYTGLCMLCESIWYFAYGADHRSVSGSCQWQERGCSDVFHILGSGIRVSYTHYHMVYVGGS
jgi:hypothetical protein